MRVAPTCIALVLFSFAFAESNQTFRRLNIETGLSENHVYSIHQDTRGYMWFATRGGIDRFDGFHVENIVDSVVALTSSGAVLRPSRINNTFWIATAGLGFCLLDCAKKTATSYPHLFDSPSNTNALSSTALETVFHDADDTLWIGTYRGLNSYSIKTGKVAHYPVADREDPHNYLVLSIHKDRKGVLWVGTAKGLYALEPGKQSLRRQLPEVIRDSVTSMVELDSGELWIATCNNGAVLVDQYRRIKRHILLHEDIYSVLPDYEGEWFGTASGKLYFQQNDSTPVEIDYNEGSKKRFPVNALCRDRSGTLWIGTLGDGVWSLNPREFSVEFYSSDDDDVISRTVWSLAEDRRGRVWVGTGNGIASLDRDQREYRKVPGLPTGYPVRAICEHNGELWSALLGGGIVKWTPGTQDLSLFVDRDAETGEKKQNLFYALHIDHTGNIWAGTNGGNIASLDERLGTFTHFLPFKGIEWTLSIKEKPAGTLWLGTWSAGLVSFDTRTRKFSRLPSRDDLRSIKSSNRVLVVHPSNSDSTTLWLGTHGSGLMKYDVDSGSAVPVASRLEDAIVYGICEDRYGTLWITTHSGLFRFDPTTDAVKKIILPGQQVTEFCLGAACRTKDGRLLMGGRFGIVHVSVLSDINRTPPQVVLKRVSSFGVDHANEHQLVDSERLELSHTNDQLSVDFLALHYKRPEKNTYAYRLLGYEAGWNYSGTVTSAHYNGLHPGEYVFEVKAANDDGVWGEPVRFGIHILQPVFLQGWFVVTVLLLVGGGALAWHRSRIRRTVEHALALERARRIEEQRVLRQVKDDVHDTFSGIVARISALAKEIKDDASGELAEAEKLRSIAHYADSLLQGYLNIQWEYDPDKSTMFDLVAQLKRYAGVLFTQNDITFTLSGDMSELAQVELDILWRKELLLMFYEGMNNVARHAAGCTVVGLSIQLRDDNIELCLEDNGCGMQGNPGRRNGMEHMAERARRLGGKITFDQFNHRGMKVCFRGKLHSGRV